MHNKIRKEGEYPFYPIAPEYGVVKPVTFMVITDEKTLEEKPVIDYSGGITNTAGTLQCG